MFIQYLTASILIAQGLGHSLGVLAGWTNLPVGFRERAWLFSSATHYTGWTGRLFGLVWLGAGALFTLAGFGLIFHHPAWLRFAVYGAGLSLLAILPWWRTVTPGPKQTALVVDVLVLAALLTPWSARFLAALAGG